MCAPARDAVEMKFWRGRGEWTRGASRFSRRRGWRWFRIFIRGALAWPFCIASTETDRSTNVLSWARAMGTRVPPLQAGAPLQIGPFPPVPARPPPFPAHPPHMSHHAAGPSSAAPRRRWCTVTGGSTGGGGGGGYVPRRHLPAQFSGGIVVVVGEEEEEEGGDDDRKDRSG